MISNYIFNSRKWKEIICLFGNTIDNLFKLKLYILIRPNKYFQLNSYKRMGICKSFAKVYYAIDQDLIIISNGRK